ncbi:hypothetical protein HK105_208333 [Polyrhizophydium stewartii]|uniref:C2H2-type domain-containing protein n=1 Tax=Polyrhizophydium stewartii TaxID=2732419 RepID=A0ABR4MYA4_9FUNG
MPTNPKTEQQKDLGRSAQGSAALLARVEPAARKPSTSARSDSDFSDVAIPSIDTASECSTSTSERGTIETIESVSSHGNDGWSVVSSPPPVPPGEAPADIVPPLEALPPAETPAPTREVTPRDGGHDVAAPPDQSGDEPQSRAAAQEGQTSALCVTAPSPSHSAKPSAERLDQAAKPLPKAKTATAAGPSHDPEAPGNSQVDTDSASIAASSSTLVKTPAETGGDAAQPEPSSISPGARAKLWAACRQGSTAGAGKPRADADSVQAELKRLRDQVADMSLKLINQNLKIMSLEQSAEEYNKSCLTRNDSIKYNNIVFVRYATIGYECPLCPDYVASLACFTEHIYKHYNRSNWCCTKPWDRLDWHFSKHEKNSILCLVCKKICRSRKSFYGHQDVSEQCRGGPRMIELVALCK